MSLATEQANHNQTRTMIRVEEVTKSFGSLPVIRGVSFEVKEHEVVAIIGTSGCGKSTLLRVISGLEEPTSGSVELNDPDYTMVFQYSALFDSLTVLENVGFSLIEKPDNVHYQKPRLPKKEIRRRVTEKLRQVGLDGIEDQYPNELSGGMKKRVSFARAIMGDPKIIMYDEPTAGLDPIASTVIENYILKLRDELGAASVVVTHQFSTIKRTADRVLLLHEGQIKWQGTPDELMNSDNPFARQFANASLSGPMMQQ